MLKLYARGHRTHCRQAAARRSRTCYHDLFRSTLQHTVALPITDNGMHLTESGYALVSGQFLGSLGLERNDRLRREDIEPLRQAIIAKNQLFFYRWRPENETYLFGFRKHEQGRNAKEVAEFDPLVARAEEEIEKIRKTLK